MLYVNCKGIIFFAFSTLSTPVDNIVCNFFSFSLIKTNSHVDGVEVGIWKSRGKGH